MKTDSIFDVRLHDGAWGFGYTKLPNLLLRRPADLGVTSTSQLIVLVELLTMRWGDRACVSLARLSRDTLLSVSTVKRALHALAEVGLIEVARSPWSQSFRPSNTYRLQPLIERLDKLAHTDTPVSAQKVAND